MADSENTHRVFVKTEQDAVVADVEAERTGHVTMQGSNVATTGPGV